MSSRRTGAIAIGVGAATAVVLSLAGAKTPAVIGSAAALGIASGVAAGRKGAGKRVSTIKQLVGEELLVKVQELGDVSKSDLVRACGYVSNKDDGGERLNFTAFFIALLDAKEGIVKSNINDTKEVQSDVEKFKDKNGNHENSNRQELSWKSGRIVQIINGISYRSRCFKNECDIFMENGWIIAFYPDDSYQSIYHFLGVGTYYEDWDIEQILKGESYAQPTHEAYESDRELLSQIYSTSIPILLDDDGAELSLERTIKLFGIDPSDVELCERCIACNVTDLQGSIEYCDAENTPERDMQYVSGLSNFQDAMNECIRALEINPQDPDSYYNRAIKKAKVSDYMGDYQTVIDDYNQAIELNPNYADAYYRRGQIKDEKLGDYQGAVDDYSKALKIDPQNTEFYKKNAFVKYKNLGDYQGAINDFTTAIEITEQNWSKGFLLRHRGIAKKELEDLKGACEDWKKAAGLDDEDAAKLVQEHC